MPLTAIRQRPRSRRGRRWCLAAVAAAGIAATLVGCGAQDGSVATTVRAGLTCPGATRCPYDAIAVIGNRAEGVLRAPEAIAVAPDGDVYVGDQYSFVIQRFTRSGTFVSEWGSYGSGPGQFGAVGGLAVDSAGDVYIVDSPHDRVEKFDPAGRLIRMWGTRGSTPGQFHFGGGAGPDHPPGGAIAVFGRHVYVSDTRNNRIERFTLNGAKPLVIVPRAPGRLAGPRGLAATSFGLYVADNDNRRVELLRSDGRVLARAGALGAGPVEFANPYDVAVDRSSGAVFVADDNNNRVVKLDRRLSFVGSWSMLSPGRPLSYLRALATDAAGDVYVAATADDAVGVFDSSGRPLRQWGVSGTARLEFDAPVAVANASDGNLLVLAQFASQSRIDVLDPGLHLRARWTGGGGAILGHFFFTPTAAAVAHDGSVWVSDRDNGIVRHLDRRGRFLAAIGAGPRGQRLSRPHGIAIGPTGALYVVDTGHDRIVKFSPAGRFLRAWGGAGAARGRFSRPLAVAMGSNEDLYVADAGNNRIERFTVSGRLLNAWGARGSGRGRFRNPDGVAVDSAGQVFVADTNNDRIEEFTARGRFVEKWGSRGTGAGQFIAPGTPAVTCSGAVAVPDIRNNRLELFAHAAAPCPRR